MPSQNVKTCPFFIGGNPLTLPFMDVNRLCFKNLTHF